MADVRVANVSDVTRAFMRARDITRAESQSALKAFARPVANEATVRATAEISGIARERQIPTWAAMRVGILTNAVYIAPVRRGSRSRRNQAIRRPNLKGELLVQMERAAVANEPKLRRRYEEVLQQAGRAFAAKGA